MRNKNAKELIHIIRLLVANDDESALLGLALFKDHYLLTNLNKHKKFRVSCNWPGRSSEKPEKFNGYGANWSREFTKNEFIKEIYVNNTLDLNAKILLILNFIKDSTYTGLKRNRNASSKVYNMFYELYKDDKEIFQQINQCKFKFYCTTKIESYRDTYEEFLKELDQFVESPTISYMDDCGINNHIREYKSFLQNRYCAQKNKQQNVFLYDIISSLISESDY